MFLYFALCIGIVVVVTAALLAYTKESLIEI